MFQLCPECHNHYDDSCQRAECGGPGGKSHKQFNTSPIHDHVTAMRALAARPVVTVKPLSKAKRRKR